MPIDLAVNSLATFIEFELWAILGSLAAVVAYQMVARHINTQGLLNDKRTKTIDPGRVQLLLATLTTAVAYLANPHAFADVSVQAGAGTALGASNVFYLIKKYRSLIS